MKEMRCVVTLEIQNKGCFEIHFRVKSLQLSVLGVKVKEKEESKLTLIFYLRKISR